MNPPQTFPLPSRTAKQWNSKGRRHPEISSGRNMCFYFRLRRRTSFTNWTQAGSSENPVFWAPCYQTWTPANSWGKHALCPQGPDWRLTISAVFDTPQTTQGVVRGTPRSAVWYKFESLAMLGSAWVFLNIVVPYRIVSLQLKGGTSF